MSYLDVREVYMPNVIGSGQKTVSAAGTAEALVAAETKPRSGVTVKALASNGGDVYVGNSTVDSANGFVLAAGESVFLEVADLQDVYIDVATNGNGVSFLYS